MLPQQLQSLIERFTRLPGIGPRQAARFVFYLLRNPQESSVLADTLKSVNENIKLCGKCFLPANNANLPGTPNQSAAADGTGQAVPGKLFCAICISPKRDKNIICIVEKETDALNLEKTGQYNGHYFILGGFIDPLNKESIAHERLNLLTSQLSNLWGQTPNPSGSDPDGLNDDIELILALTPRREGDFTSLYIEDQLKGLNERGIKIKTTRLGRGLSSGAELEYADEETLKNAFESRK